MGVSLEAIKTEHKAWNPGAPDVVCQRHFADSDYRRLNHSKSNIDLLKSEYKSIVLAVCHVC